MTPQQQRFLELRAEGASYDAIATDLQVSRRTLFYWKDQMETELSWEETVELETLQQELLGNRKFLARRFAQRLNKVEAELDKRSLEDLSTARLIALADSLRNQILRITTPAKPARHTQKKHDPEPVALGHPVENENPSLQESSQPAIAQCNDSAKIVQSPLPAPALETQPIQKSNHPSIQSPEAPNCKNTAMALQPELQAHQAEFVPIEHETKHLEGVASVHAPAQQPTENCNNTANVPEPADNRALNRPSQETQNECKRTATSGHPSSGRSPIRCMPISAERLVGTNVSFREVLEKRRLARANQKIVAAAEAVGK